MSVVGTRFPSRRKAVAVIGAAVAVTAVATVALGLDPLGSLVAFVSLAFGNTIVLSTIAVSAGVVGAISAIVADAVDLSQRAVAKVGAAGAAVGGVVGSVSAGVPSAAVASATSVGPVLPSGSVLGAVVSVLVAFAIGNPFLIALVGAAVVFFLVDPLSRRGGGFLSNVGFAIKISAVALLAFLTVTKIGPEVSAFLG